MKRAGLAFIVLSVGAAYALRAQDGLPKKDTVYQMSPVVVTATQASERKSPVTFSNLTPLNLRERYSVQDVPVLLSELPSITTYSENGNGIGYNYINLRGFDQRRISVMINGVPQNDPEDHNVYWIDFPDLLASTDNIQVQRGAGNAFYGPAAIGGSVNLVTNPFGGRAGPLAGNDDRISGVRGQCKAPRPDNEKIRRLVHVRACRGAVHVLRPARQDHERRVQDELVGRHEFLLLRRDQVRRRHVDALPFLRRSGTGRARLRRPRQIRQREQGAPPPERRRRLDGGFRGRRLRVGAVPPSPGNRELQPAPRRADERLEAFPFPHAAQHTLLLHRGRVLRL